MSRLAKDLFIILKLISSLRNELGLLMCASLIVANSGDNVLTKSFAMSCGGRNYTKEDWSKGNIRFMGFRKTVHFRDGGAVLKKRRPRFVLFFLERFT